MQNRMSHLRTIAANKTKLIEVIRRHIWEHRTDAQPAMNKVPNFPKNLQCKNKRGEDSTEPQPPTHNLSSEAITPRRSKLSLVGKLSRNSRQAKRTTFKGISLC